MHNSAKTGAVEDREPPILYFFEYYRVLVNSEIPAGE